VGRDNCVVGRDNIRGSSIPSKTGYRGERDRGSGIELVAKK
jgi:hypothetical protein